MRQHLALVAWGVALAHGSLFAADLAPSRVRPSVPLMTAMPNAAEAVRTACFRQQASIGRAMRAFNIEARKPRRDVGDLGFFQSLVRAHLLDSVPQDPGFGAGSYGHYRYRRGGNGITCYHHGDPETVNPSEKQACFALQRTLVESLDSLARERGGTVAAREVGTRKLFEQLVAGGHLEALPIDPGQGRDSYRNFRVNEGPSAGLECAVHGAPSPASASPSEECYRVQARVAQAVARFNADKNVVRTDVGNKAFFLLLVRENYLPELPEDPGQGAESFGHFRYCEDGNHVECTTHGRPAATAALVADER